MCVKSRSDKVTEGPRYFAFVFSHRASPTRGLNLLVELQSSIVRLAQLLELDADKEPMETCTVDGKTARALGDADWGVPRTHMVSARLDLVVGQTAAVNKVNKLMVIR